MHKKILSVVGITILFLGLCITPSVAIDSVKKSSIPISNGNTLYVGGSGEGNYTRIQDAVDNASNGDTVFVYNGTYYEHILINSSIDMIGEDRNTTIIDGMRLDSTLLIEASFVNINRFTVQNSKLGFFRAGIKGVNVENIQISNCNIIKNNRGIKLGPCSDISINNCDINSNKNGGGLIYEYSNIEIDSCHIGNNGASDGYGYTGISFYKGSLQKSNIKITNCDISENIGNGIFINYGGENINIHNNAINNNGWGVVINDGVNVDIHHNTIFENSYDGILFSSGKYGGGGSSSDVCIYNNYISQNGCNKYVYAGIKLQGCYDCVVIKNNIISSNMPYSVYLRNCSGNKITENNFINSFKDYSASFGYDSIDQSNIWSKNYWNRPRVLPKIIPGIIFSENGNFPWIQFDWRPAKKPYDIKV